MSKFSPNMISVSLRFRAGLLVTLLGSALVSQADILKLRNGTTLDGKILSETDSVVEIEVKTGSILDTQKVSRKDIQELIKSTPDQVESVKLTETLVPSKDQLSDAGYQKILDEQLLPFLKKYPTSPHKAKVEAIVKTYQEEMAKAKTGSQKIEGQWVSAQELQWNAYNIEARLRRMAFQDLLNKKDYFAAYQILTELERDKPASVETNKALELFKGAIPAFDELLDLRILEQPIQVKQTADGLKSMTPDQRKDYENAKKQAEEDFKARVEEARKQKSGILPYNPLDLKSIQDAKASLKKESDRINKIDLAKEKLAAEAFQTGLKNLTEKSYLSAKRNFEEAGKAFPKETFIKERFEVAKRAAEEEAKVKAETGPAVTPASTDPKKAATPAKTAAGAPVKTTAAAPVKETSTEEEAAPEEEKSNMPMYLIAGAAALLLVGLAVKALSKKKPGHPDD